ncbi:MAG: UvrB/UvrC motif-containing protein [Nanoarchaeota archaeon]
MKNKLKELLKIGIEIKEARDKKIKAVSEQHYELASSYRDIEKKLIEKIEKITQFKESDFESKDILDAVREDLYKVVSFIEDGDSNLTPALIRKLVNDTKEVKKEVEDLKEQLKKQLTWTSIDEGRPKLVEDVEVGNKTLLLSEEVVIFYISESGEHNICIGKYVVEENGVHDKKYYFVANDSNKAINLINVKGWKDSTDKAVAWFKLPNSLKIK